MASLPPTSAWRTQEHLDPSECDLFLIFFLFPWGEGKEKIQEKKNVVFDAKFFFFSVFPSLSHLDGTGVLAWPCSLVALKAYEKRTFAQQWTGEKKAFFSFSPRAKNILPILHAKHSWMAAQE